MLDIVYDPPDRNPGKPLKWILIDTIIITLLAFVSALPIDHLPTILDLYKACNVASYMFLYTLATQLTGEKVVKPWYRRRKRYKKYMKQG